MGRAFVFLSIISMVALIYCAFTSMRGKKAQVGGAAASRNGGERACNGGEEPIPGNNLGYKWGQNCRTMHGKCYCDKAWTSDLQNSKTYLHVSFHPCNCKGSK